LSISTERYQEKMKEIVDEHGLIILAVIGAGFSYAIGMAKKGFPDVIISTEDPKLAHYLLNRLYREWVDEGVVLGVNADLIQGQGGGVLRIGLEAITLDDEMKGKYICQALAFYERYPDYLPSGEVSFVQAIWPDEKGLWPNESNYDHDKFPQQLFPKKAKSSH
jgi:hypothetical protein